MIGVSRGNLQPAHKGYRYQDIATAYILVRSLVERYDEVVVDRKEVPEDKVDDLEIVAAARRVRHQFKSSDDPGRSLRLSDFTSDANGLRFDQLVLTFVRAGSNPANEYRLCATWSPPRSDDPLAGLLEPVDAQSTIQDWPSRRFRLNGDLVWPEHGEPVWNTLKPYTQAAAEFGRAHFIRFCQRFIIELSLPMASTDFSMPGALETALTDELAQRVGIGRYPNRGRLPRDVAALAVSLANSARTQSATLTPCDVEHALEIRTDFGRVAQAFPIDDALYYDRSQFRQSIGAGVAAGRHQIVLGPPGIGKSWELTRLAEELRSSGVIVARHYCYLSPSDELMERRVTVDVFIANLRAELVDAVPELRDAGESRYAAELNDLEKTLTQAVRLGRPVVLIIDGIDHIARVSSDARYLSDDETDIIERLASMTIPPGATIVIGSQPGTHLDPLRNQWEPIVDEHKAPAWRHEDIIALARLHGVDKGLEIANFLDPEARQQTLKLLADKAEGNPLYARYLASAIVAALRSGSIADPREWLEEAPTISGDIAVYYDHLYKAIGISGHVIADILSSIEFSITVPELQQMLPPYVAAHIPSALDVLSSVLTVATAQGGMQIFHESFRRFMRDVQKKAGREPGATLQPVISWLEARGFFRDARSFRYLLPALRRAEQDEVLLNLVGATFVSDSVACGHPIDAIHRNIALAANVAARRFDWPALVRCVELHRSAFTCFDDAQGDVWVLYWTVYLKLFGPEATAERLLFDGQPTQSRATGLLICTLIDDVGGVAPWQDYLNLRYGPVGEREYGDDKSSVLGLAERLCVATVQGRLRLRQPLRVAKWFVRYLNDQRDHLNFLLVRTIGSCITKVLSSAVIERLSAKWSAGRLAKFGISSQAMGALRLGLADEYIRLGKRYLAVSIASVALREATSPSLVSECLAIGARGESPVRVAFPESFGIGVETNENIVDARQIRSWITSLRLLSGSTADPIHIFNKERERISGVGWYRCWLSYVLAILEAEVAKRRGQKYNILTAFEELSQDTHPFRGRPRACDLYSIRAIIQEMFTLGLSMLATDSEWRQAVCILTSVANATRTRIDREDGGPIPTGMILELLLPHVGKHIGGNEALSAIEKESVRREEIGTYYGIHAECQMQLVLAHLASDHLILAKEGWKKATIYLSAYGWHKDTTIYELLDSIPALRAQDASAALSAAAQCQPLADAVIVHTDLRSTRHAPNSWLYKIFEIDAPTGIALLARTIVEETGASGWQSLDAIRQAVGDVVEIANPILTDALLSTLDFEVDADNVAQERINERIAPISRLAHDNLPVATQALRRAAASVGNDGAHHANEASEFLRTAAAKLGVRVPTGMLDGAVVHPHREMGASASRLSNEMSLPWMREPAFRAAPTLVDIMGTLRRLDRRSFDREPMLWTAVNQTLSYYITGLLENGGDSDTRRLLRVYARDVTCLSGEHPLADLARTLEEAGHQRFAAIAFAQAYTATRGGGGWLQFGGPEHGRLLASALNLDRAEALQVLAEEVAYALRGDGYSMGISRHLIQQIAQWGEFDIAAQAWAEALAVMSHRLPLAPDDGWFSRLNEDDKRGWTVDESLVALILARISTPLLKEKTLALAGFGHAIRECTESIGNPLGWWLTYNVPNSSVLLVLDALWRAEQPPFSVSRSIEEILGGYVVSDCWGARRFATLLLTRAGLSVPTPPPRDWSEDGLASESSLSKERLGQIFRSDVGNNLDEVAKIWPNVTSTIAKYLDKIFTNSQEERAIDRYELAFGRDRNAVPSTPVLYWETELFLAVLHNRLNHLRNYLWSTGRWRMGLEDELLLRVMPSTATHIALAESRTIRPTWPEAASLADGVGTLPSVGADDPEFEGWRRLAIIEHQYLVDPGHRYDPPNEIVRCFAGAVAIELGQAIPDRAFPFATAAREECWQRDVPPPTFPPRLSCGPIIALTRHRDWLGDVFLPFPPLALRRYIDLRPPTYAAPLIWTDAKGLPALAVRSWCVRNSLSSDANPVASEGVDMVARVDVVEQMQATYGVPLKELRNIVRNPVER